MSERKVDPYVTAAWVVIVGGAISVVALTLFFLWLAIAAWVS